MEKYTETQFAFDFGKALGVLSRVMDDLETSKRDVNYDDIRMAFELFQRASNYFYSKNESSGRN